MPTGLTRKLGLVVSKQLPRLAKIVGCERPFDRAEEPMLRGHHFSFRAERVRPHLGRRARGTRRVSAMVRPVTGQPNRVVGG